MNSVVYVQLHGSKTHLTRDHDNHIQSSYIHVNSHVCVQLHESKTHLTRDHDNHIQSSHITNPTCKQERSAMTD